MRLRIGLVCDLSEEGWPSMDLVADMLAAHLPRLSPELEIVVMRPLMRRRATRLPLAGRTRAAYRVDRYSNRYIDYQRWLRRRVHEADVFHIVDHSYAHLAASLPAERTVVTCHDIDAFRCLAAPRGGGVYRRLAARVLEGMRQAAAVTCDTHATRSDLIAHNWLPADRIEVAHNGVHPAYHGRVDPGAHIEARRLLGAPGGPVLLHVGSTIARKRIDVLLRVFAELRRAHPGLRLVRAGGPLTREQRALARALRIDAALVELPFVPEETLAAVYQQCALTLLPSAYEGFGLPLVESMACGTPVVASRIPALVEVGGLAAVFAPEGDIRVWAEQVSSLLAEREEDGAAWRERRDACARRASEFSWGRHARTMAAIYRRLAIASAARNGAAPAETGSVSA